MRIFEWIWRLLPDRCEVHGCSRRGVRGNESVIEDKRVCDHCHAAMMTSAVARNGSLD